MKVLIVGAGAVGIVYGYHLAKGGADVDYFVKDKYFDSLSDGIAIYKLGLARRYLGAGYAEDCFDALGLYTKFSELENKKFDYVIFSVDSTALQAAWLARFSSVLDTQSQLVMLQPGVDDRCKLEAHFESGRITQGMIGFIAFQAPLKGAPRPLSENAASGFAYYLPPVAGFFENSEHGRVLKKALAKGGFRSRLSKDMAQTSTDGSARFIPLVAALEVSEWKLEKLLDSENLSLGLAAGAEAAGKAVVGKAIVGKGYDNSADKKTKSSSFVARFIKGVLPLAVRLSPFDLEVYLQYHFSKVGAQTVAMLESYIAAGESVENLQTLLTKLKAKRAQESADVKVPSSKELLA